MLPRVKKFFKLPSQERKLFLEALFLSYRIWTVHLFVSFKKLQAKYACQGELTSEVEITNQIRTAIRRASKLTFWRRKCLVQSLVARKMLNRRNISSIVYLSICEDQSLNTEAHAWVRAGEIEVVDSTSNYKDIHQF